MASLILNLIRSQFFSRPAYPTADFSGKTIIVTGANIGLGLEACKHFVRLGASKVILASRSVSKGETAKIDIEHETKRVGVVDVWPLDLSSYISTKAFAKRCAELPRIDAAILNAGVATEKFEVSEGHENTITVNVISTALLTLLLLPALRLSASKNGIEPVLDIVGSGIHKYTVFAERSASNCFNALDDKDRTNMSERYAVSKLLQVWVFRELANRTSHIRPFVTINGVSPGLNRTALVRDAEGMSGLFLYFIRAVFGWHPEVGSRTLVHAATVGPESHGVLMSNGDLHNLRELGENATNQEGQQLQKKIWRELVPILEVIEPGVTTGL